MSAREEIELTSCQNCGHEWEPNEETHCPLCRWRLARPVKTLFEVKGFNGSVIRQIVVPHVLGDVPLRLPLVKFPPR